MISSRVKLFSIRSGIAQGGMNHTAFKENVLMTFPLKRKRSQTFLKGA